MKTFVVMFFLAASLTVARRHHGEKRFNPKRFNHTTPINASYAKIHLREKRYHRQLYGLYGAHEWKYYVRNATLVLLHDQPKRGEVQGYYGCSRVPANLDEIVKLNAAGVKWVGLVDRGNCYYYQKVQYAFELGAVGLLVRSNTEELMLMNTIGNHIPSLMIKKSVGEAIQREIKRFGNGKIRVTISRVLQEEIEETNRKKETEKLKKELLELEMMSAAVNKESSGSNLLPSVMLILFSYFLYIVN